MATKNKLDDMQIRRWIAAGEPVAKSDGDGLTFTLSTAGSASWVLRYRLPGKRRELTIGNYPDISLAAARKIARQLRVDIDLGKDPAKQKSIDKARAKMDLTVRSLALDFLEKKMLAPEFSAVTIYYRTWDINNVIIPKIGFLNVKDMEPAIIVDMLDRSGRTWTVQKRILTSAKKMFDHAIGKQIINVNPCAGLDLKALIGPRPKIKRRIMLSVDELKVLFSCVDEIGKENALALKIVLGTCVRTNELVKARWEDIDFEKKVWRVPDDSVKTRSGFLVPLAEPVIEWFRQLHELSLGSEWVLPARSTKRTNRLGNTHIGNTTLWAAITRAFERGEIGARRFTPHDMRSTAKGHMRNMGISREISELALNHKLKGMEGIYDVREEIPEKREALNRWAEFIVRCL
ncbi:tyrosine-type recombinase/integrase [Oxalobacter formigenes]|uniref:tyrosine-type recombinase/integrase n=1 Tax=Oxalobacter formigenes TaxID=847 RepID=UPI00241D132D|nr:site-specific integrase [Oxalobacter formigenes]